MRILRRVFLVHPRHATSHLLGIGVLTVAGHARERAAILVLATRIEGSGFVVAKIREGLLGSFPERLTQLGRVDLGKADLYLLAVAEKGEGVAVVDGYDVTRENDNGRKKGSYHTDTSE